MPTRPPLAFAVRHPMVARQTSYGTSPIRPVYAQHQAPASRTIMSTSQPRELSERDDYAAPWTGRWMMPRMVSYDTP